MNYEAYIIEGMDYEEHLRSDLEEALNNLYDVQNEISLSSLSVS